MEVINCGDYIPRSEAFVHHFYKPEPTSRRNNLGWNIEGSQLFYLNYHPMGTEYSALPIFGTSDICGRL